MDIIMSTRNPSKVAQIGTMLGGQKFSVLSLSEAGIDGEAEEDGATLEENALKKAFFAWEFTQMWSIADDTGLFIDALDGQPGIYAARWAGKDATTEEIMNFTLDKLSGVPTKKRTATFKTVAAVISPDEVTGIFIGEVKGRILTKPRTKCQKGMPYSAIFVPNGQSKVWAEMSIDEANKISHRGKAFRQAWDFLQAKAAT
jgi:XTP/dITP diphosphohydrolase